MANYRVTFQYSETTYCTNIAIAEDVKDVARHYDKHAWYHIEEATEYDMIEAERKGMPIITIEPTRIAEDVEKEILDYYIGHEDELAKTIEELDYYNNILKGGRFYDMDDIKHLYTNEDFLDLIRDVTNGGDSDTRGAFNPARKYFYYNYKGGIVSTDEKDYTAYLNDDDFLEGIIKYADELTTLPTEVKNLVEELRRMNMKKYQINIVDANTGAETPIEVIEARDGYTAEDYIRDCEKNADEEYVKMLHENEVYVYEIEEF